MFNVGHRPPDGPQARVRVDEDVGAGRGSWCRTKSWKPLMQSKVKQKIQEWLFNLREVFGYEHWFWDDSWPVRDEGGPLCEKAAPSHLFSSPAQ